MLLSVFLTKNKAFIMRRLTGIAQHKDERIPIPDKCVPVFPIRNDNNSVQSVGGGGLGEGGVEI